MAIIEVDRLSKDYTYYEKETGLRHSLRNLFYRKQLIRHAVRDVSFEVEEGEIVGFLGPNGAGKTTTLKLLSGILHPTSGTARVMGFTPWERKKEYKMNFSIVMGQKSQLWWDLPANESLALNKSIYELSDRAFQATLDELAELLDVRDLLSVQVRRLSLGERMKIELIASLIHRPKIMFLDEPTIGLDLISQKNIRQFIKTYSKQTKTTILLTSHYMADIENLCKRSVVINHGSIVFDGELSKMNRLVGDRKRLRLQFGVPVDEVTLSRYGRVVESGEGQALLEVEKQEVKTVLQAVLDVLPIVDFNVEELSIEDGLSEIYKKERDALEVGGQIS